MSEQQTTVVEDHSHDRIFVVTFLAVLAVLVGIAIVIAIIANVIDPDEGLSERAKQRIAERIEPVGQVYTDASQVPAETVAKADTSRDPQQVLQTTCGACHATGVLEAPKTGDAAAWEARLKAAGGLDALVQSAIDGKGNMPARGGDASLSDEVIRAVVKLMVEE